MTSDISAAMNGISERVAPGADRGRLIEAEHVARYLWAAQVATGRRVLDAGCGTGYGARILAEGGARDVVGVDHAPSVLEAGAPGMPEAVRLQAGDVSRLAFEDDSFELVVCFEVLEHVEEPRIVLDELVRVLAPGGLLLISSAGNGAHQPGAPGHRPAFAPDGLESELGTRLRQVRLTRQHDYVVSALHSEPIGGKQEAAAGERLALTRLVASVPGEEISTLAMASDSSLPEMGELAAAAGTLEMERLRSAFETHNAAIADKDITIYELRSRLEERERLAELLSDAEQRLARLPELTLRIADLEFELTSARADADAARTEVMQLDQMLMYGRRMLRYVRPLIKPLRDARRRLRRR